MDAVGWDRGVFDAIALAYSKVPAEVGITDVACIPISALPGDDVVFASANMAWYSGPTLLAHLETVRSATILRPSRFGCRPMVNRPDQTSAATAVRLRAASWGAATRRRAAIRPSRALARIVTMDGDLDFAVAGEAVTLTVDAEIDISRGDLLAADTPPGR